MEREVIIEFQQMAVRWGAFLVGVLCLMAAYRQRQTGETRGLSGKGRVLRSEEPGYFRMLFAGRLILGIAAVAGAFFLP